MKIARRVILTLSINPTTGQNNLIQDNRGSVPIFPKVFTHPNRHVSFIRNYCRLRASYERPLLNCESQDLTIQALSSLMVIFFLKILFLKKAKISNGNRYQRIIIWVNSFGVL